MKSKRGLDEIKACGLDEIKSVFNPSKMISSQSDFICGAELLRRKTD